MPTVKFLHPDIETLAQQALRDLQVRKWERQWAYVRQASQFYRRKLGPAMAPELTLDDLQELPPTDKEELRQSQEADYPFGDYIACKPEQVVRIHQTSGTTGRALILANTQKDVEIIAQQGARGMYASGLRPGNRVVHCLNYCLWTGGVTDHMTLEATGATVIPFGVGEQPDVWKFGTPLISHSAPSDVGFFGGFPFLVDFDEDGGDQASSEASLGP